MQTAQHQPAFYPHISLNISCTFYYYRTTFHVYLIIICEDDILSTRTAVGSNLSSEDGVFFQLETGDRLDLSGSSLSPLLFLLCRDQTCLKSLTNYLQRFPTKDWTNLFARPRTAKRS